MCTRLALVMCVVTLSASPAGALSLLTRTKLGIFRNDPATGRASAFVRTSMDPALERLSDPRCPATSFVRLASNARSGPELELPCTNWRAVSAGYIYRDPTGVAGPVRRILYHHERFYLRAQGPGATVPTGPVGYAEMWLTIGPDRLLARFHKFARNDALVVRSRVPSRKAAEGEAAFWSTLWSDGERSAEAIASLERAVARDPSDGRSLFLLGMMHLYNFGREGTGFRDASEVAKREAASASAALDAAVPLLPDDARIPGFRAAATYVNGVAHRDAGLVAAGLTQLDAAVPLDPLFNSFDFIGVVPAVVAPGDPLMVRALELVDAGLGPPNVDCVQTMPEICGNAGMAPHNTQGALLLFGDLYAKGDRLSDAERWYG